MNEILRFSRRVEEKYDGTRIKIEKTGVHSFQITTASAAEFDFRNRIFVQQFDQEFISQLNQFFKGDNQLNLQDREVHRSLENLRQQLQNDTKNFEFRV